MNLEAGSACRDGLIFKCACRHAGPNENDYARSIPYSACGAATNRTGGLSSPKLSYKGYACPADQGQQCIIASNPNYGFSSFDNFGTALLIMVQV